MPRPKTQRSEAKRITQLLQAAGLWQPQFADTVAHLAQLYAELDQLRAWYEDDTQNFDLSMMITHQLKDGSQTAELHPALREMNKIITQCLPLEIQLGLTPAAHRRMTAAPKEAAPTFAGKLRLLEAE